MNPEVSNDVIATHLEALTAEVGHLRDDLKEQSGTYVRASEWKLRAEGHDREVVQLREQIRSVVTSSEHAAETAATTASMRHIPWTAIVAAVVAIAAVLFDLIPRIR